MRFVVDQSCRGAVNELGTQGPTGRTITSPSRLETLLKIVAEYEFARILPPDSVEPRIYRLNLVGSCSAAPLTDAAARATRFEAVGDIPGAQWERLSRWNGEVNTPICRRYIDIPTLHDLVQLVDVCGELEVRYQRRAHHAFRIMNARRSRSP